MINQSIASSVAIQQAETIDSCSSALHALSRMRGCGVRALVAVDGPDVVGVVTEHDIIAHGMSESCLFIDPSASVLDVMVSLPQGAASALTVQDSLGEALRLMRLYTVDALPVTEHGRLKGLLTKDDILKAFETDTPHAMATSKAFITPSARMRGRSAMEDAVSLS